MCPLPFELTNIALLYRFPDFLGLSTSTASLETFAQLNHPLEEPYTSCMASLRAIFTKVAPQSAACALV